MDAEKSCLVTSFLLLEIGSFSGISASGICFVLSISPLPVRSHSGFISRK
nr:MAG TPA: hypothetical protein [Caudoviricetes sp.]